MSPLDMKFHGTLIAVDQKEKKTLLGTDRPVGGIASCVAASFPRDPGIGMLADFPFGTPGEAHATYDPKAHANVGPRPALISGGYSRLP